MLLFRCSNYLNWKSRYQAVYNKFITPFASSLAFPPVKIAILDTGIDLTHPDVEARSNNIKGKYNWLNEKFKNRVHDRNGHGTFGFGLLLDYAPDAQLYVAKIAEDKPSNPSVIAKVNTNNNYSLYKLLTRLGHYPCRRYMESRCHLHVFRIPYLRHRRL